MKTNKNKFLKIEHFCVVCVVLFFVGVKTDSSGEKDILKSWNIAPTRHEFFGMSRKPDLFYLNLTPVNNSLARTARKAKRHKYKIKRKYQKFLLPLLIGYKLKFFTLIPVLIGGLILLAGSTGLAGFFFALFAAVMSLKATGGSGHSHH